MLQSLNFINWVSESKDDDPDYWRFDYTLIDDVFGMVIGVAQAPILIIDGSDGDISNIDDSLPEDTYPATPHLLMIGAIIQEYYRRHLPVEGQLARYLLQCCKEHHCSMRALMDNYNDVAQKEHNAEFAQLWKLVNQTKVMMLAVFE